MDIESGKFEAELDAYERKRQKYIQRGSIPRQEVFEDWGDFVGENLRNKIILYH